MTEENSELSIDVARISAELKIRPEIYVKIVVNFAASLTGKMNILNDALAANDRDQMRMILHEIKGTAGNLRLHSITAVESMMHDAVKAGVPTDRLSQYFESLRSETEKLQQYVQSSLLHP